MLRPVPTALQDPPTHQLPAEPPPEPPDPSGQPTGLNLGPDNPPDGWHAPPPVRLSDGTYVRLYKDGESLRAAYEVISKATRRICLEFYIFADDETGTAFADLLCEKAKAGVEVFVIYDSWGSLLTKRAMWDRLRDAGARVVEFHPLRPWDCRFSWRPYNRDHRKLVVVDGHMASVGGLNLGTEYAGPWVATKAALVGRKPDEFYRDNAIGLRGPSVRHLERVFERNWSYLTHGGRIERAEFAHNLALAPRPKAPRIGKQKVGPASASAADSDPGPHALESPGEDFGVLASAPTFSSPLRPFLNSLVRQSTASVQLVNPYFAPDEEFIEVLCDAARRGVKVELMMAGRGDFNIMMVAARAFYAKLLDAGVVIYERQRVKLHAKGLTIDGEICLVGSANLDYRSIEINCELLAVIRSKKLGGQMRDLFANDVKFSRRVDPAERKSVPWRDRLVQWAVSRIRYFL